MYLKNDYEMSIQFLAQNQKMLYKPLESKNSIASGNR